jgi:hypothetical protein
MSYSEAPSVQEINRNNHRWKTNSNFQMPDHLTSPPNEVVSSKANRENQGEQKMQQQRAYIYLQSIRESHNNRLKNQRAASLD